ncbi:MAG TPA: cytochrome P450, partial [Mycobacteriales bacterium]|nr:cytochrome P450 [Mycobacteriales bacterium]
QPDAIDDASQQIAAYMARLVADKRSRPGQDLLSDLVAVRDAGDQLDDAELVSMATLLLVAGHETTTNLIGNGTLALLSDPDSLAALRADPGLLPSAVEELLRYNPPAATATFRWTTEPVHLGDVVIPADQVVMISLAAANHDPAMFPDPGELDLDRDTGGHLAFGYGIHYCLGAPLARMEARIAFHQVLARLPDLSLACDPAALRWRHTRLMRGLEHLPVTFTATNH